MEIFAEIKNFKPYQAIFEPKNLTTYQLKDVISGAALAEISFFLQMESSVYAVSRWTGPKRSRTYPYPTVYDIINHKPKVALIPFVKDEGKGGDRDFLQYDTISLLTLLGVYVITTYYLGAERSTKPGAAGKQKITNHRLDRDYVRRRLEELAIYPSDPSHWNRNEISSELPNVIDQTLAHYPRIEAETGVQLKSINEIVKRKRLIADFQEQSRKQAMRAQKREQGTTHQRERSGHGLKALITIKNFIKGLYYFTVDEAILKEQTLFLIEKKHGYGVIPSSSDIKDGLLKLILYHNIDTIQVSGREYKPRPVLGLTSDALEGYCHNRMSEQEIERFFLQNRIANTEHAIKLRNLFEEAKLNKFIAYIVNADKEENLKERLLSELST